MGQTLYLEQDQIRLFLDGIPTLKVRKMTHEQIRLMFEVLFYGAMRISEVLQLKPDNLVNGKIRLDFTKGGVEKCKCSKWLYRPTRLESVDKDCKKCLGKGKYRISVNAYVIESVYDDLYSLSLKTKVGNRIFPISRKRAWEYADAIMACRTHTFRHSFLTWMLEKEKFNVRDIMNKARHKSLGTTTHYIDKNVDLSVKKENLNIERL
jgi:integrase